VLAVIAAAGVIAARQPSRSGAVSDDSRPGVLPGDSRPIASSPADSIRATPPADPKKLVASPPPHAKAKSDSAPAPPSASQRATPSGATSAPAPATDATTFALVTISGCLEANDATFSLKDADGDAAPKSRSWKSGFLRKRSRAIALVDAGHTLELASHVGQRVAATGALVDGELRARSLETVAASCR
jgi:hypothetical protein